MKGLERAVRTTTQVAFLLAEFGLAEMIIGHGGRMLAIGFVAYLGYRLDFNKPSMEDARSFLTYAEYSLLTPFNRRMFGWTETAVLAFFVRSSLLGIYEAAWGVASLLTIVGGSIGTTVFTEMRELNTEKRYDRIHNYLKESLFTGVFSIPGFFGSLVVGLRVLSIYWPEF